MLARVFRAAPAHTPFVRHGHVRTHTPVSARVQPKETQSRLPQPKLLNGVPYYRSNKNTLDIHPMVQLTVQDNIVTIKGPKGEGRVPLPRGVGLHFEDETTLVVAKHEPFAVAGTTRALIGNFVKGVTVGFRRKLNLIGVGFKCDISKQEQDGVKKTILRMEVGFSHPILYEVPPTVEVTCPSKTQIVVRGVDAQQVGLVASRIRDFAPPNAYTAKGIRYSDEEIVKKPGKQSFR